MPPSFSTQSLSWLSYTRSTAVNTSRFALDIQLRFSLMSTPLFACTTQMGAVNSGAVVFEVAGRSVFYFRRKVSILEKCENLHSKISCYTVPIA